MARSSVKLVPKVLGSEAKYFLTISIRISVTRSDDLLDFGQLLQAFGNNLFVQISHILREFLKGVKIYHFSIEIIFGQVL